MASRVVVALLVVGVALTLGIVFPFVPRDGTPIPGETWRVTTHGDGVVTIDRERKMLRIDVNAMPQDFLICIGAVCKLPAEWRAQ